MKVVVIGDGGGIGSKLVTELHERGHQTVVGSPDTGVNSLTGASVVVDISDTASFELRDTWTRNLLAAEAAAGVGHHVALLTDGGRLEELIRQSSIPYSIVRATEHSADLAGLLGRIAVGSPLNGVIEAHS